MVDYSFLSSIPFFYEFSPADLADAAGLFTAQTCREADIVFRRGNTGRDMFFIQQGRVDVIWDMSRIRRLILASIEAGSFFGEMALLDDAPRSATIMAVENCVLASLSREGFTTILKRYPAAGTHLLKGIGRSLSKRLRLLNEHLLFTEATLTMLDRKNQSGDFTDLRDDQNVLVKREIHDEMVDYLKICGETRTAEAGEILIEEGAPHREFYLIQEGTAEVNKLMSGERRVVLTILGPGNICGEMSFLDSEYPSAEVRAREPMSMCVFRPEFIEKLSHLDVPLLNNIYLTVLRHICMNIRLTNEHYITGKRSLLGLNE